MKNKIVLILTLLTTPLLAGPYCIDNSEHLARAHDTKEWHSIECDCNCETIRKGYCTECGHRQNARIYEIVKPTQSSRIAQSIIHTPEDPQVVLEKLATHYLQNKYDV